MRYADGTLQVDMQREGTDSIVTLRGELDVASCPLLEAATTEALREGCRRLVVSLAGVDFVDVAGVRCLQAVLDQGRHHGARTRLVGARPAVERVMGLVGLVGGATAQDHAP